MCCDYGVLDRKTRKKRTLSDITRGGPTGCSLAGHKYFIHFDLASEYCQIPISEQLTHKTAFVTPDGQLEYLCLPFGLINAPSVFQHTIFFLSETKIKYAVIYMDDILIPAHDFEWGLLRLIDVLELLRKGDLTLKLRKCNFFYTNIKFLGFKIGVDGIRPGTR